MLHRLRAGVVITAGLFALLLAALAQAQSGAPAVKGPWSDKSLSPDQRADLFIGQMTLMRRSNFCTAAGRGR